MNLDELIHGIINVKSSFQENHQKEYEITTTLAPSTTTTTITSTTTITTTTTPATTASTISYSTPEMLPDTFLKPYKNMVWKNSETLRRVRERMRYEERRRKAKQIVGMIQLFATRFF